MTATSDPYAVLGVAPGVDDDELDRRYRRLVRRYPPELSPQRFAEIQAAYDQLRSLEACARGAMCEIGSAIDQLYPPPEVRLKALPPAPPPPTPEAWEAALRPLREAAIAEVLAELASEWRGAGGAS
jgi:hypothetical protein